MRLIGVIKWFDNVKGFGIISRSNKEEFFLHQKSCINFDKKLQVGQCVTFENQHDKRKDRNNAIKCKPVGQKGDWNLAMEFLDKKDTVEVTEVIEGKSRWGNPYRRKENITLSILDLGTRQIANQTPPTILFEDIIEYFKNELSNKLFIKYCNKIENSFKRGYRLTNTDFLKKCFTFFGENMNEEISFLVWKSRNYKYANLKSEDEIQIDPAALKSFIEEIEIPEFRRLSNSELYSNYCSGLAQLKILTSYEKTKEGLSYRFGYLQFLNEDNHTELNEKLSTDLYHIIKGDILIKSKKLGMITDHPTFKEYSSLDREIPYELNEESKISLKKVIQDEIIRNSSDDFLPELWLKALIEKIDFGSVIKLFLESEFSIERSIKILDRLSLDDQVKLIRNNTSHIPLQERIDLFIQWKEKLDPDELPSGFEVIRTELIEIFDYNIEEAIKRLHSIVGTDSLTNEQSKFLKHKLEASIDSISTITFLEIRDKVPDFGIIESDNQLLKYLGDKKIESDILFRLVRQIDQIEYGLLEGIIIKNKVDLDNWERQRLIEKNLSKKSVLTVLLDQFFHNEEPNNQLKFNWIFTLLDAEENQAITKVFLDGLKDEVLNQNRLKVLQLGMKSDHATAPKMAIAEITFKTEEELILFLKLNKENPFDKDLKECNPRVAGFLQFIQGENHFVPNNNCKEFFLENMGVAQTLSAKYLIYLISKGKITVEEVSKILESFNWTEINVILIKGVLTSKTEGKILLKELDQAFKVHFELLSKYDFTKEQFFSNFQIGNILKKCNGRTFYNFEKWEGNGVTRNYVNETPSTQQRDAMDCYCEGRPWKKTTFWDSTTNKKLSQEFELYWCKTMSCTARNDEPNLELPFNEWTIQEISHVLGKKLEKLFISTLSGWANRMNQIVEHLFCRDCDHILRPLTFTPKSLGFYAVPMFHCINTECTNNEKIRFTHCLNGKCVSHEKSAPLDSRDCESCNPTDINHTGLQCNHCGSSCPSCSGGYNKITVKETW